MWATTACITTPDQIWWPIIIYQQQVYFLWNHRQYASRKSSRKTTNWELPNLPIFRSRSRPTTRSQIPNQVNCRTSLWQLIASCRYGKQFNNNTKWYTVQQRNQLKSTKACCKIYIYIYILQHALEEKVSGELLKAVQSFYVDSRACELGNHVVIDLYAQIWIPSKKQCYDYFGEHGST